MTRALALLGVLAVVALAALAVMGACVAGTARGLRDDMARPFLDGMTR